MEELAKIEEVDLREAWSKEDTHFTPWLAEHLSELGNALGLEELELQGQEVSVGGFSLDILASDRNVGNVVIENQLEATDHTHLGQLLTYAAGFADANVMVWIAKEFSDEHRAALDFLNDRTVENTKFFGVVIELLKIDNSRPAPHFRVVSAPNDWSKETKSQGREVSERNKRYQVFFQPLMDRLSEDDRFTCPRTVHIAPARNGCSFSTGRKGTGTQYQVVFRERLKKVKIDLLIDSGNKEWNKQLFDKLEKSKEEIQFRIKGDEFMWERLDDKRACRISVVRSGSIDDNPEELENIREWMFDRLIDFERVFGPILAEIVNSED